ncbi:efflux RND transporter periplasmic adaptor subunit [Ideonella sp. A 288]|uniref:efflux RND transporter periplasmic adaptor subunit n=1 Tax=Ideonella sp. A 288 TaxID=1962181 RepID=UPI000B4BB3AB|nr:efflux RND transporter periplasmic adaptor subunit [Ideonella sp. A 288]
MSATGRKLLPIALLAAGVALGWGVAQWRGAASHAGHDAAPAAATSAGAASAARQVLYWYDPMVPTQRFDKPGKSPFMDMQLVPRYADEGEVAGAAGGAAPGLAVSTQAQQALGMRLATVEKRPIGAAIEATGTVQLNERDISIVQARTAGFVERVHARAPGDVIAAGAPLVDLMNPEWLGAQQEYLAVKAVGDAALTAAARQRLLLLGMPTALIEQVERSGQAVAVQTITAPTGGVISELMVRTGMTVAAGMTLARINGLGTVWLEAAVPEALAASVQPGQRVEARFAALPGEAVNGRVTAVLPEANRDTRTLRLRIELPNPGQRLRAGLFAQVTLRGTQRDALVVPTEAVIRTGRRALVYLAEAQGRYRPVEVTLGEEVDDRIVVRSGLAEGQQVVASGQFLVDSEASLQGVLARAATAAVAGPTAAAPTSAKAPATAANARAHPPTPATAMPPAAAPEYATQGTVVDIDADSLTLKHDPVPALKWPAMTMPFKLADPALAKGLKKGQAVQFSFRQQGDEHVVTRVAPASGAAR